jgi:hypothetical protein
MKVYAIISEYGAGCIYENVERVCKTRKIAESWYLNADFIGRPCRIDEIVVIDKPWTNIKSKKKKKIKK